MGFFDAFTGASQRRDIQASSAAAQGSLADGRAKALAALQGGADAGRSSITGGYDAARTSLQQGIDAATGNLTAGFDRARGDLTGQYGRAEKSLTDAYGRTEGILNPLIELGRKYDTSYADATGINGADARTAWFDQNVRGNQDFAYADELAAKQLEAQLNAQGVTGGRAGAMLTRQGASRIEDRTNQLLDRIRTAGDRGAQSAGQLAGYSQQTGQAVAGVQQGLGDRLGTLESNRGTSLADLSFRGGAALADNATGKGNALAQLGLSSGGAIAGIESGYGQQTAANAINTGNAVSATRNIGLNNALGLVGLGMKAFTPGIGGVTPAAAISGGMKSIWAQPSYGGPGGGLR